MLSPDRPPESRDCYWSPAGFAGLYRVRFESSFLARTYAERALRNYDGPDVGFSVIEPREIGRNFDPTMWRIFESHVDHALSSRTVREQRLFVATLSTTQGLAEVAFNAELHPAGFFMGPGHAAKLGLRDAEAIDFLAIPWAARIERED